GAVDVRTVGPVPVVDSALPRPRLAVLGGDSRHGSNGLRAGRGTIGDDGRGSTMADRRAPGWSARAGGGVGAGRPARGCAGATALGLRGRQAPFRAGTTRSAKSSMA